MAISSNGTNWQPWVTYKTGAYLAFVPRAQAVIRIHSPGGKSYNPSPEEYLEGAPGVIGGGISGFFSSILDGHTLVRIALVIVGAALIYLAILQANRGALMGAAKLAITKKAVK